jgi:hypothetical protein
MTRASSRVVMNPSWSRFWLYRSASMLSSTRRRFDLYTTPMTVKTITDSGISWSESILPDYLLLPCIKFNLYHLRGSCGTCSKKILGNSPGMGSIFSQNLMRGSAWSAVMIWLWCGEWYLNSKLLVIMWIFVCEIIAPNCAPVWFTSSAVHTGRVILTRLSSSAGVITNVNPSFYHVYTMYSLPLSQHTCNRRVHSWKTICRKSSDRVLRNLSETTKNSSRLSKRCPEELFLIAKRERS